MHRTNLYLTDEQERELDARARRAGVSRSALVRSIIDRELAKPQSLDTAVQEVLGQLADDYHDLIAGLFDDDPDLRIDR
jgi:metal-responsive CopG/Arc/MetJ family transcriptional regulator